MSLFVFHLCSLLGFEIDKFGFSQLFKRQGEFFDIPTSTLTPLQTREKLAALAAEVIGGGNSKDSVLDLLTLKSSPNGGVDVTDDLKYTGAYS